MSEVAKNEAASRAERIRLGIRAFVQTLNDIADAYKERDWLTLGYESWDAYVAGEFSEVRLKLSTSDRQRAVEHLREAAQMSTRAIGAALGISEATVRRDLAGASNDAVTGLDGRTYAAKKPRDYNEHPLEPGEPEYEQAVEECLRLTQEHRDWLDALMRKFFIPWKWIPKYCEETGLEEDEVYASWKRVHPEAFEDLRHWARAVQRVLRISTSNGGEQVTDYGIWDADGNPISPKDVDVNNGNFFVVDENGMPEGMIDIAMIFKRGRQLAIDIVQIADFDTDKLNELTSKTLAEVGVENIGYVNTAALVFIRGTALPGFIQVAEKVSPGIRKGFIKKMRELA